ncbi:radical SAM protein, partial [[Eubacterium] cellulosolvens]
MRRSRDNLSPWLIDWVRDRMVSLLLKTIAPAADSLDDTPRIVLGSPTHRILNWLGRLCGFDPIQVENILQEGAGRRALWNFLKSVSDCGIGIPQTLKAPVSVVWSLSYGCNLRCMHCNQEASQPSSDELTLEQQLSIVDQMARAGVSMVVLSGG